MSCLLGQDAGQVFIYPWCVDYCLQRVVPAQKTSSIPRILCRTHGIPYGLALCWLQSTEIPIIHAGLLLLCQPQRGHPILLFSWQQRMVWRQLCYVFRPSLHGYCGKCPILNYFQIPYRSTYYVLLTPGLLNQFPVLLRFDCFLVIFFHFRRKST